MSRRALGAIALSLACGAACAAAPPKSAPTPTPSEESRAAPDDSPKPIPHAARDAGELQGLPEYQCPHTWPPVPDAGPHSVKGGARPLPPDTIQAGIRQLYPRIRACYEEGLARDGTLKGTIWVDFRIFADGATLIVGAACDTSLFDRTVVACVVRTLQGLKFPPASGSTVVHYPVAFSPEDKS